MMSSRARKLGVAALLGVTSIVSAAPARADDADHAATEELAARGRQEYLAGRFPEAIAAYVEAFDRSGAAVVLFNIATIYDRKLHETELASEYYRRYIKMPDAEPELVRRATERLAILKREGGEEGKQAAAASAASASATSADAARAEPSTTGAPATRHVPSTAPIGVAAPPDGERGSARDTTRRTASIVAGSVGLVGIGASLALGAMAKSRNDDADSMCRGAACASEDGVRLAHEAGSLATASTVAFVSGVSLVTFATAFYFFGPRGPGESKSAGGVSMGVASQGAGLQLRGSF